MEAHNIQITLTGVPKLKMTANTTAKEADAAFPQLASFNQGGIFVGRYLGQPPWECHPHGDELLHVLNGEIDLTLLTDEGPMRVTVEAGSVFVVPQGLWHRPVAHVMTTLLSATPQPSKVSLAADPRYDE